MQMKYKTKIGVLWTSTLMFMLLCTIFILRLGSVLGVALFIILDALFVHMTLNTWYKLEDTYLEVRCGIFTHIKIPYDSIKRIEESRSPMSSAGLSIDRIYIDYTENEILISPEHKQDFLQALKAKVY